MLAASQAHSRERLSDAATEEGRRKSLRGLSSHSSSMGAPLEMLVSPFCESTALVPILYGFSSSPRMGSAAELRARRVELLKSHTARIARDSLDRERCEHFQTPARDTLHRAFLPVPADAWRTLAHADR